MGVLNRLFGRLVVKADPSVTTQTTAVIQATDTNSGIALVPNGTGAITAQVPDGTTARGNARGQYAVDLQTTTNVADRVASGNYSVISGGRRGKASGLFSTIGGGDTNFSTGDYSTNSGGASNVASSNYSTISGGQSNTASTGTHATVVGGNSNTSAGQYSVSGGNGNTVTSGGPSGVALGGGCTVSGTSSVAMGSGCTVSGITSVALGNQCTVSDRRSVAMGFRCVVSGTTSIAAGSNTDATANSAAAFCNNGKAYLDSSLIIGNGLSTAFPGYEQAAIVVRREEDTLTTGATTIVASDLIPEGNNRAWNVTVEYVGVCTAAGSGTTTVGDVVTGTDKFRFKRVSGTSTIGSVTNIELTQDASMTSAECTYAVGGSNDLQISFAAPTTANSTTFKVVAKVSLVEVAW